MPTISIIIPTFNRPHFLAKALASVREQTFKDWECIVIDDGSAESAQTTVESAADKRVRYVRQMGKGRSAARNKGISLSDGEFIAFLDDDDWFLPNKLQQQLEYLQVHQSVDGVVSGVLYTDQNDSINGKWAGWLSQPNLTLPACLLALPVQIGAILFRRRVFDQMSQWFDQKFHFGEDTDFLLRVIHNGFDLQWLKTFVSVYRQHDGNSQGNRVEYAKAMIQVLENFFRQPISSPVLLNIKGNVLAHYWLSAAIEHYAHDQITAGTHCVNTALGLNSSLFLDGSFQAQLARKATKLTKPKSFVATVFTALPKGITQPQNDIDRIISKAYMSRVFSARATGQRIAFSDWINGVRHDPSWLLNRGVWSILLRNLLPI